jgi:hypothetical protein
MSEECDKSAITKGAGHTEDHVKLAVNAEVVRSVTVLLEDAADGHVFPAIILHDEENRHTITIFARDANAMFMIARQMAAAVEALELRDTLKKKSEYAQPSEN